MRMRLREPFPALPLTALLVAVAAVLAGALLVGCGSSDGEAGDDVSAGAATDGTTSLAPTVPEPTEGIDGLPADQVVFQAQTGGGFVPMQAAATEIPEVTIYGDGRVFVTDPAEDRPYDVGPGLLVRTLPADELRAFLADATGSGLFSPDADFGQPMVTDLPTTTVTLHTEDPSMSVSAYALTIDAIPGGGLTDAQVAARQELSALVEAARALGEPGEPWAPDRVRATLYDPTQTQREGSIEPGVWPGPPFAEFPAPTPEGAVASCLVIEGDEATAVWDAASSRGDAWWVSAEGATDDHQIVVVPLLPGAEGCPPA